MRKGVYLTVIGLFAITAISTAVVLLSGSGSGNAFAQAKAGRLTAVYTKTAPTLSGKLDDPAWSDAQTLKLMTAGDMTKGHTTTGAKVELKALYTDNKLYIAARWPDPTVSMTRGGSWV